MKKSSCKPQLSSRVNSNDSPNLLHSAWYRQHSNPYDEIKNPEGIINLGTSENRVVYDIVDTKLKTIDIGNIPEEYTHYCKLSGTDQFLDSLSTFFNRYMKPTEIIERDDIFVMNGCGTVVEALGYAICNEGDGILIPAPYYCGFKSDLEQRIGVKTYPVHVTSNPNSVKKSFSLTVERLEETLIQAEEEGVKIKALLISNPNNPLGNIYTADELQSYIKFCHDYNIHLICDEIYMLSVYDEKEDFTSVLALKDIVQYRESVHVVWGFSKDFGLSGFRCGAVITHNKDMQVALRSLGYYTSVPTVAQYVLEELINDQDFLNTLIKTNHARLLKSSKFVTTELSESNIEYLVPTSGFFVWANFSKYLKSNSKQSEVDLFNILMENGVYIVPGFAFETKERGWFRIIISHNINLLKVALERITNTLAGQVFLKAGFKRLSSDSITELEQFAKKRNTCIKYAQRGG